VPSSGRTFRKSLSSSSTATTDNVSVGRTVSELELQACLSFNFLITQPIRSEVRQQNVITTTGRKKKDPGNIA